MINYQRIKRLKDQHTLEREKTEQELAREKAQHKKVSQVLEGTLHEVRRFSNEISAHSERLSIMLSQHGPDTYLATELSNTIFYTSGMLAARLAFADLELNPASVVNQPRIKVGIYKKCEKAKHILNLKARAKDIDIRLIGSSYFHTDLLLAFELVPFVLLENAIKYSPSGSPIMVTFTERLNDHLTVEFTSIGPQVNAEEIPNLTARGFRGQSALLSCIAGDGLGLYLVDFLCGLHDVQMDISSSADVSRTINRVPYSYFKVTLTFLAS
jgi:signal transduction histidine kinase